VKRPGRDDIREGRENENLVGVDQASGGWRWNKRSNPKPKNLNQVRQEQCFEMSAMLTADIRAKHMHPWVMCLFSLSSSRKCPLYHPWPQNQFIPEVELVQLRKESCGEFPPAKNAKVEGKKDFNGYQDLHGMDRDPLEPAVFEQDLLNTRV